MSSKKSICFSIPCYNEKENIVPMAQRLLAVCEEQLSAYDCTIQFIDNCSTDGTRDLLRGLCAKYPRVRAILNARNFPETSGYYGMTQAVADATIAIPCDFQVSLDMVPKMVHEWENGAKIVCLVKKTSEENSLMWGIRQLFYKLSNQFSDTEVIRNYSGNGLYDRSFLDICRKIDDPVVTFCTMVVQLGYNIVKMPYEEKKRRKGRSKNNVFSLLQTAIMRF
ncbi:MAG: glycosyltransferase family 2 protein, partial [Ruthenibacterium sp.]